MDNPRVKVKIKATGKEIEVYRYLSKNDVWISCEDHNTEYKTSELIFA